MFEGGVVYFKIRDFRGAFIRGGRLFEVGRLFEEIRYRQLVIQNFTGFATINTEFEIIFLNAPFS